jgi:hypothetical protein
MVVPKSGRNKTMPAAGCGLHRHQQSLYMVRGGAQRMSRNINTLQDNRAKFAGRKTATPLN